MIGLTIAVLFTLGVSGFCSLLEAMVLSTTTAEIEALKKKNSKKGKMLEDFREGIEETSSAILALNTVANTLGAIMVGVLASKQFGPDSEISMIAFPVGMTIGILLFSEIVPKNVGVIYRSGMQAYMVYPLCGVRVLMYPMSWVGKNLVKLLIGKNTETSDADTELILLAQKNAKDGELTNDESKLVANALKLDDVGVRDIMTPRTVVTALDSTHKISEIFAEYSNIPFARMPVFNESIDNVVGIVRRRDLLQAKADDKDDIVISSMMHPVVFIPEHVTAADALKTFLRKHQQIGVVVDEFGSVTGVITMEDIIEHLIGQEIFEKDDMAVDMREFAREKKKDKDKARDTAMKKTTKKRKRV